MTRRKNVKRIDPRYFLDETVDRNDDGSALDEGPPGLATTADMVPVSVAEPEESESRLDRFINWAGGILSRSMTGLTDEEIAALSDLEVRDLIRGIGGDPTGGFRGGPESMFEEKGKEEKTQRLVDAGMMSPEEAKNALAGRSISQGAPSPAPSGPSKIGPDLGTDEVDSPGKPGLKKKVAALAKKFGICEETLIEDIRKVLNEE